MERLAPAAFAARLSYNTALAALMRGDVAGERRGESWWVDAEQLKRYAVRRRKAAPVP